MSQLPDGSVKSDDKLNWMRLNLINGLGPRLRQALFERFESPAAILQASKSELLQVPGIGNALADAVVGAHNRVEAQTELMQCQEHEVELLAEYEDDYPRQLREIADPPGLLYVRGKMIPADALAIAIVGTRHGSKYGLGQAERFASGLASAGFTIVSGLARGIDTKAHEAALAAGGRTIAVLGSGLLNIYPSENKILASAIANSGAVVTENTLNHKPKGSSFPQRNRIVTGLSLGVIVIEAAHRSGALISARHAMEQNREVFALPGRVDSRTSSGCHHLIRDGAKLVENVDHVLEELGPLAEKTTDIAGHPVHHPAELQLNDQERQILKAIDDDVVAIESIVNSTELPVSRILSTLSVLEMKRLIKRIGGSQVSRC